MPLSYLKDAIKTNMLPDPELNPMLNPLLAANMGRWAEVYFTSPPERREQAVAELIRELGGNPSNEHLAHRFPHEETMDRVGEERPVSSDLEPLPDAEPSPFVQHLRTCAACAYENSDEQKFCGMCGTPLSIVFAAAAPQIEGNPAVDAGGKDQRSDLFVKPHSRTPIAEGPFTSSSAAEVSESDNSRISSVLSPLPSFAREPETVPYRYRLYVGTALAVLLVLLVYMSWRGTKAMSGTSGSQAAASRVIPPAPSALAHDEQQPSPAPVPRTTTKNETGTVTKNETASPTVPALHQKQAMPSKPARETQPAARVVTKASSSSAIALEQSSQQDLATAQQFLNGIPRDSKQASTWLWKAVSKGNPTATIELSDLYLRGDGVPKNCDQARLLLDAAARKGQQAAAQRIRNLPAFGCQ